VIFLVATDTAYSISLAVVTVDHVLPPKNAMSPMEFYPGTFRISFSSVGRAVAYSARGPGIELVP